MEDDIAKGSVLIRLLSLERDRSPTQDKLKKKEKKCWFMYLIPLELGTLDLEPQMK